MRASTTMPALYARGWWGTQPIFAVPSPVRVHEGIITPSASHRDRAGSMTQPPPQRGPWSTPPPGGWPAPQYPPNVGWAQWYPPPPWVPPVRPKRNRVWWVLGGLAAVIGVVLAAAMIVAVVKHRIPKLAVGQCVSSDDYAALSCGPPTVRTSTPYTSSQARPSRGNARMVNTSRTGSISTSRRPTRNNCASRSI